MTTTVSRTSYVASTSKGLHVALWTVQILLGLVFAAAGFMKLTQPIATLAEIIGWPGALPPALVRFIGVSELLGGLGLILPAATRIKPELTPLAGLGLTIIMVLAAAFHVSRGELSALPTTFALGALAALVAWGRWRRVAISAR
jgi:putative oxidoreductase